MKLVVKHVRQFFGEDAVYFDVKAILKPKGRKGNVTDGLLIDFNDPTNPFFWVVEVELGEHSIYRDLFL